MSLSVPRVLHRAFRVYAKDHDKTMSQLLREFMRSVTGMAR